MKYPIFGIALASAAFAATGALAAQGAASPHPVHHFTGEKLASKAAVTEPEAEVIALKAHPGQITDRELEKEKGGSGLRYSFDIKSGGKTYEVGVDAKSGAVLENDAEGKNPD